MAGTVLGTGLIALDVVVRSSAPHERTTRAGGTCGNVLSILSYLGWRSYPLSRMNGDGAGRRLREDLLECGVRLDFAGLTPTASTPVVVHHIRRDRAGGAHHRFSMSCPDCGSRLPSYRPVTRVNAEAVSDNLPSADYFFLDRVSRAAVMLAAAASQRGALVVFEPSGVGDPKLFREALALADILKYSRERLGWLAESMEFERSPLVEIETHGSEGLRYRTRIPPGTRARWRTLPAYRLSRIKDGAGAGDWCTAGMLHTLGPGGKEAVMDASADHLDAALRFGQAAGAWACIFEGARSGMYEHEPESFREQVAQLQAGREIHCPPERGESSSAPGQSSGWCEACART